MLRYLAGLVCALALMPGRMALADDTPALQMGVTTHVALDKDDKQDWVIPLAAGSYTVVLDAKRSDDHISNIQANIALLKNNGVIIEPYLVHCNEIAAATRVGATFKVAKPYKARLRLTHDQSIPTAYWVTVVPTAKMSLLPFGFVSDVLPAKISSDEGVGGEIAPEKSAYYSLTLPPGRWSISLGLKLPKGTETNLQGKIDLLTPFGLPDKEDFVHVNEIGNEARKEAILTVVKPRKLLMRVTNDNSTQAYSYDVSVEKATD